MAFGILECKEGEIAPGTVLLSHELSRGDPNNSSGQSVEGQDQHRGIILVPQPSGSPNDPLNWPQWRKDIILLIIALLSGVTGAFGPMLGPAFVEISQDLGVSVSQFSQATAYMILTMGLALFISNPLAKVYGKRPVYLGAGAILFASSVWGALSSDFNSLLGSRILGGIGMGPFEVLVQCTIADLYFVHQRATRFAFWSLSLLSGIAGGPLISAYIIQYSGYRWTFGTCAILYGSLSIAFFFLAPETTYIRKKDRSSPESLSLERSGEKMAQSMDYAEHVQDVEKESPRHGSERQSSNVSLNMEGKDSYWMSLRVYTGRYEDASFFKVMSRPFILFLYPSILWGFFTWGTTITFVIVFSFVNGVIFEEPPYNFTVSQVGLINISPWVLSVVTQAIAGPLCDQICVYLTRKNRGVYEPEFRLVLMIVVLILGVTGFFGFGATVYYETHWSGPVITYGLVNAALAFCSTCVFGYIVDAYNNLGEEAFVAINARNFLSFGLLYFVEGWLSKDGVLKVFCVIGSIFVCTSMLTIPLWIFGKRIRAKIHKISWLNEYMAK